MLFIRFTLAFRPSGLVSSARGEDMAVFEVLGAIYCMADRDFFGVNGHLFISANFAFYRAVLKVAQARHFRCDGQDGSNCCSQGRAH